MTVCRMTRSKVKVTKVWNVQKWPMAISTFGKQILPLTRSRPAVLYGALFIITVIVVVAAAWLLLLLLFVISCWSLQWIWQRLGSGIWTIEWPWCSWVLLWITKPMWNCRCEGCDMSDDEETVMLMRSIESSLLGAPAPADDEPSERADPTDSESDTDELSELAAGGFSADERASDWEHVPLSIPEVDMSLTSRTASPSYFSESQAATVTSIVSSAASSALSFWRGWSRGSDKWQLGNYSHVTSGHLWWDWMCCRCTSAVRNEDRLECAMRGCYTFHARVPVTRDARSLGMLHMHIICQALTSGLCCMHSAAVSFHTLLKIT